jgi:2,5-diketo-D-gluconate reductase A
MKVLEAPPAPEVRMSNGLTIPQLGLGTWPLKGDEATAAVRIALSIGYRLVDTAEAYENEEAVGKGIRDAGVPRDQLFLTTKLNRQWHSRTGVRQACEASLARLGMSYIDLFLIHWPNPDQDRYVEAFEGMGALVAAGLVRSIGVSNFKPAHLEKLFAAGLCPQLNQIQLDPYRQREDAVSLHKKHGITTGTWSPLDRNSGMLKEPAILAIAEQHGRTPAQVVLRWHVQNGYVATPKSANPQRQLENLDVFGFELNEAQMDALRALNRADVKIVDSDVFWH